MLPLPLELVVLMISESDLRSALTARLTMLGFNVVTLGPEQKPAGLPPMTVASGVLVTDDSDAGLIASDAQPWIQVIVLNGSSVGPGDRPLRLSRRGATRLVVDALERLRAPDAQDPISESDAPR